jgi:hypothetical protein
MWVKLDDRFDEHPKLERACCLVDSLEPAWAFVAGLAYCNRNLTDGHIPLSAVRRLAWHVPVADVARALIAVGLWEAAEGGFQVHDYAVYQPSSEAIKTKRAADKKRQADWRAAKKVTPLVADESQRDRQGESPSDSLGSPAGLPGPGFFNDGAGVDDQGSLPTLEVGSNGRRTPLEVDGRARRVGGKSISAEEWKFACLVLDLVNAITGSHFASDDWRSTIVLRVRERPELTLDDHQEMIAWQYGQEWWRKGRDGRFTPALVYGNARIFDGCANAILSPPVAPATDPDEARRIAWLTQGDER